MAKNKKKNGWVKLLLTVLLLVAAAAAILFLILSRQCGGSRAIQQAQVEMPVVTTTAVTTTTTVPTTTATTTVTTTTQKVVDYDMKLDPSYVEQYDATNSDVAGWILIDGTIVDYPVIQCGDNDTYIHSDWMGNYSYSGCIYEDFRCNIDKSNLVLMYGHNMADGSMFSTLRSYQNEEWGREHLYFEVASEEARYLYEVFSVNVLYGMAGADFGYWRPEEPSSLELDEEEFEEYIDNIVSTSLIWYGEDNVPEYGDRIIGLQTCNSGNNDGMRCLVYAKCLGER